MNPELFDKLISVFTLTLTLPFLYLFILMLEFMSSYMSSNFKIYEQILFRKEHRKFYNGFFLFGYFVLVLFILTGIMEIK